MYKYFLAFIYLIFNHNVLAFENGVKCDIKRGLNFEGEYFQIICGQDSAYISPQTQIKLPNSTKTIMAKDISEDEIESVLFHPFTPLFSSNVTEVITKQEDIIGAENIYGILGSDDIEDALVKYLPPDEAYNFTYLEENPEKDDFVWDDNAFTAEDYAIDDEPFDEENGIADPNALDGLATNIENIVTNNGSIDSRLQFPEDDYENINTPDNKIDEPEIKQITIGDKEFEIQILGTESEDGIVEEVFTINDGLKAQKFRSPNLLMLTEAEGLVEKVRFENDNIYLTLIGMDEEEPLGVTPLGNAKNLTEKAEEQIEPESKLLPNCLTSLSNYFKHTNINEEQIKKFLGIQSKLTLHRLAWANLHSNSPKNKLENNILKLIKEKYTGENAEIAKQFDKKDIRSRHFLAKAIPLVKDVLNSQISTQSTTEKAFHLAFSDLKMLELIAEYEEINPKTNSFDYRQFNSENATNNITNFATMINSSYQQSDHKLSDQNSIDKNKYLLNQELPKLSSEFEKQLKLIIYEACFQPAGISCEQSLEDVNKLYSEDIDVLMSTIMNELIEQKDEDIINDAKYGNLWLRVAN